MNIDYKKIFYFSVSQPDFSTRINFDRNQYLVNQIFSFELSELNFEFLKSIIDNIPHIATIYVGEINTNNSNFRLDTTCINDDVEICFKHSLVDIDYPILICNEDNLYDFLRSCITPLRIEDIYAINNTLLISINGETSLKEFRLSSDLCAFFSDSRYLSKEALVIPDVLPNEYWRQFSNNILEAFFDSVSERVLAPKEFLIKIGNVASVTIPEDISFTKEDIEYIYSIVKFIFGDANRYEDKLQILRKVMTNYFSKNYIENISWKNIFQVLKDNYSLFIDKKIDTFLETEQKLYEQLKKIYEDIIKDIEIKIDELSKQILTILATVISSFVLKINDEQRLLFLGAAILYSGVLLVMNGIKGFHFSSKIIEKRKEKLQESLVIVISTEQLEEIGSLSKPALRKLYLIETFQKLFLIIVFCVLIMSFIIA